MNLQKIEQVIGITTIITLIVCLIQAYLHSAVLPLLWLQIYLAVGGLWIILYIFKVQNAYRNKKLFFTNTLKWWNVILYLGIMSFLLYLNWTKNDGSYGNIRYAVAFSFLLIGLANIKNYINFSDSQQIEISYQSVVVRWEDILRFEKTINGYGIVTRNEGKYAILKEHLLQSQIADFEIAFDELIRNFDDFSELDHLIS